eukprot:COSAG06_NODE_5153_length_3676_cov_15.917529_1_plen_1081_part_01
MRPPQRVPVDIIAEFRVQLPTAAAANTNPAALRPWIACICAIVCLLLTGALRFHPDGLAPPPAAATPSYARIVAATEVHVPRPPSPPERPMGKRSLSQAVGTRLKAWLRLPEPAAAHEVPPSILQGLSASGGGGTRAVLGIVRAAPSSRPRDPPVPTLVLTVVQQAALLMPDDPLNPRRGVVEVYRRPAEPFFASHAPRHDRGAASAQQQQWRRQPAAGGRAGPSATVSGDWALCARQVLPGVVEMTTSLDNGAGVGVLVRFKRPEQEESSALRLLLYNHSAQLPPAGRGHCPAACRRCKVGGPADGGIALGPDGVCLEWCSPAGYCGVGGCYVKCPHGETPGVGTDCRGCEAAGLVVADDDEVVEAEGGDHHGAGGADLSPAAAVQRGQPGQPCGPIAFMNTEGCVCLPEGASDSDGQWQQQRPEPVNVGSKSEGWLCKTSKPDTEGTEEVEEVEGEKAAEAVQEPPHHSVELPGTAWVTSLAFCTGTGTGGHGEEEKDTQDMIVYSRASDSRVFRTLIWTPDVPDKASEEPKEGGEKNVAKQGHWVAGTPGPLVRHTGLSLGETVGLACTRPFHRHRLRRAPTSSSSSSAGASGGGSTDGGGLRSIVVVDLHGSTNAYTFRMTLYGHTQQDKQQDKQQQDQHEQQDEQEDPEQTEQTEQPAAGDCAEGDREHIRVDNAAAAGTRSGSSPPPEQGRDQAAGGSEPSDESGSGFAEPPEHDHEQPEWEWKALQQIGYRRFAVLRPGETPAEIPTGGSSGSGSSSGSRGEAKSSSASSSSSSGGGGGGGGSEGNSSPAPNPLAAILRDPVQHAVQSYGRSGLTHVATTSDRLSSIVGYANYVLTVDHELPADPSSSSSLASNTRLGLSTDMGGVGEEDLGVPFALPMYTVASGDAGVAFRTSPEDSAWNASNPSWPRLHANDTACVAVAERGPDVPDAEKGERSPVETWVRVTGITCRRSDLTEQRWLAATSAPAPAPDEASDSEATQENTVADEKNEAVSESGGTGEEVSRTPKWWLPKSELQVVEPQQFLAHELLPDSLNTDWGVKLDSTGTRMLTTFRSSPAGSRSASPSTFSSQSNAG